MRQLSTKCRRLQGGRSSLQGDLRYFHHGRCWFQRTYSVAQSQFFLIRSASCQSRANRRAFAPTPLNTLLLSLLIMVGVSLWATFNIPFSLAKVAGTLLGFFLFLGLVQFAENKLRLSVVMWSFLFGGFLLVMIALMGTGWGNKFAVIGKLALYFPVRLRGIPGAEEGFNPNAVGGSITLFLPLIPALLWRSVRPEPIDKNLCRMIRIGLLILLILLSGVLFLSQSRGAWLGISADRACCVCSLPLGSLDRDGCTSHSFIPGTCLSTLEPPG
jgi:hypothetical protein